MKKILFVFFMFVATASFAETFNYKGYYIYMLSVTPKSKRIVVSGKISGKYCEKGVIYLGVKDEHGYKVLVRIPEDKFGGSGTWFEGTKKTYVRFKFPEVYDVAVQCYK
jgi:hypothetical protein